MSKLEVFLKSAIELAEKMELEVVTIQDENEENYHLGFYKIFDKYDNLLTMDLTVNKGKCEKSKSKGYVYVFQKNINYEKG